MKFIFIFLLSVNSILVFGNNSELFDEITNSNEIQSVYKFANAENNQTCKILSEKEGTFIRGMGGLIPPIEKPAIFKIGQRFMINIECAEGKIISVFGNRTNSYVKYPYEWDKEQLNIRSYKYHGQKSNYSISIKSIELR